MNANVMRNRQIRLLRNIRDLKSFATRSRVVYEVCGRNFSVKTFDLLLNDSALCNAIVITPRRRENRRAGRPLKGRLTRVHRKFKAGPPALLFKLTRRGHTLLRRLLKAQADERAAVAQARDQAAQARAAKRQARADAKVKREAAESARKAARIAKDLERRTSGFEVPTAPPAPVRRAETFPAPPRPIQRPLPAGFSTPPPAPWGPAQARPAPIGGPNLADKIRKAGYRVNERGEVLYDNKWTPLEIWRQKMSHVNLD